MQFKPNKWIISVLIFSVLLGSFIALTSFFRESLQKIIPINISDSIILLILYIIQSWFLILFCWISIKFYLGKTDFKNKLKVFFKESTKKIWAEKFLKYIFLGIWIYFFVSFILRYLTLKFGLEIPWLFGQQKSLLMLSTIELNTVFDYGIIFLMVVIIWPILEEIIFRWFVTNILLKNLKIWLWIFFSSLIFTLIHFERSVFFNIFLLALILSRIYYKTKSILCTFWFHFLINLLWFIWLLLIKSLHSLS